MASTRPSRRAFSLTEMIIVIGVIVLLIALLFPVLRHVRGTGLMTTSMGRMRDIAIMMRQYSGDHREIVLPSTFDYSMNSNRGRVRAAVPPGSHGANLRHKGTWADIMWTVFNLGVFPGAQDVLGQDYSTDSPDKALYDLLGGGYDKNPVRSAAANTRKLRTGSALNSQDSPTPFGPGAVQHGLPGFFAANQFFDSRLVGNTNWFTTGQIRTPDRSLYLVDSWAGETIEDEPYYFEEGTTGDIANAFHVDFRYSDTCLILFLDGHVEPEGRWTTFDELVNNRRVKVQDLDRR
jgi:prepilin-type processing-associated H-X9-DG protein